MVRLTFVIMIIVSIINLKTDVKANIDDQTPANFYMNREIQDDLNDVSLIKKLPKIVVFDADKTLWPYENDVQVNFPVKSNGLGHFTDASGNAFQTFHDVPSILNTLQGYKILMGLSSRDGSYSTTIGLLNGFGITKYFAHMEITSELKVVQLIRFKTTLQLEYEDFLYFDDDKLGIESTSKAGIVSILCEYGMNSQIFITGLQKYSDPSSNYTPVAFKK